MVLKTGPSDIRPCGLSQDHLGDRIATLRTCPTFSALSEGELAALAASLVERRLQAGMFLFRQDDPWRGPYLLGSGATKAFRMSPDGRRQTVAGAKPGQMFAVAHAVNTNLGEIWGGPHLLNCYATTDCIAYLIPKDTFTALIMAHPEVAIRTIHNMCHRLQETFDLVAELALLRAPQRLAATLLRLAEQHGIRTERGIILERGGQRLELAEAVGVREETVIRILSSFSKVGLISAYKRKIVIIDPEGLAKWADEQI